MRRAYSAANSVSNSVAVSAAISLACAALSAAQGIPAPKLELIRQAMAAMKVESRIQGLVATRVESKVQAIRSRNPGASDSLLHIARAAVAGVYADHLDGPGGLYPRVHAVLDRRLSADDLKFVIDFRESDQGRRYRELAPRIVAESVEEGREWAERLEPAIHARLETALRGADLNF